MANSFIKKNWQKDATNVLVESGLRGMSSIGSAFLAQKVFTIKKTTDGKENKLWYNIGGPILTAVGIIGDMMMADPKFKAVFQGMSTYGIMRSASVIGDFGEKIGLAGAEEDAALMSGVGALGTTTVATTEFSTADTPPELAQFSAGQATVNDTDGKSYNNDWAYLAQNIDSADQITKTVSGVEPETAAALMGVATEQEAALLMGMF